MSASIYPRELFCMRRCIRMKPYTRKATMMAERIACQMARDSSPAKAMATAYRVLAQSGGRLPDPPEPAA